MIAGVALLLAGIVSDDAKMFVSGAEWLPDAVPNDAIYDTGDPSGKEIRITTNVAAAVVSCASAICERFVIGTESGSGWWAEFGPDVLGVDTFRTNHLYMTYTSHAGDEIWLSQPTNRHVCSYRLPSAGMIGKYRGVIANMADGWWSDQFDYGIDTWGNKWWGSSRLDDGGLSDVPIWDWTDESPVAGHPNREQGWAKVWPQFTNCLKDGVWRTSDHVMHGSVDELLGWWDFGPWEDLGDDRMTIYGMDNGMSCLGILTSRLGQNAEQLTNDTYRISYYRLGAIETALASMDTTYYLGSGSENDFDFERRSYFHQRGFQGTRTPAIVIDWSTSTADIDGDPGWEPYETWSTSTNDIESYSHPAFVCSGDAPVGHQIVNGSSSIDLTFEDLEDIGIAPGEQVNLTISAAGGSISILAHNSRGELLCSSAKQLPMNPWHVRMSAGVTRQMSVGYTTRIQTNRAERVTYPTPWAWNRGMVTADVRSLEYRVCCTNSLPGTDNAGYSFQWIGSDDVAERAQNRTAYVGRYSTTNAYVQAWRAQRMRHNTAVSNVLSDWLGCSLMDRENLIPIPVGPCASMRDAAENVKRGGVTVGIRYDTVSATRSQDGATYRVHGWGPAGSLDTVTMSTGSSLIVGSVELSVLDRVGLTVDVEGRTPCYSWGNCTPANRITWRFSNLREE